jgi:hypothetical protein
MTIAPAEPVGDHCTTDDCQLPPPTTELRAGLWDVVEYHKSGPGTGADSPVLTEEVLPGRYRLPTITAELGSLGIPFSQILAVSSLPLHLRGRPLGGTAGP